MLVSAVKDLQGAASQQINLQDKQLEQKCQVVGNVVALGFQMPVNMALSLTQVLCKLLTEVIEPSKDFLVSVVLDLLKDIVSRVGSKSDFSEHAAISVAFHELTKWALTLIKDRTTA